MSDPEFYDPFLDVSQHIPPPVARGPHLIRWGPQYPLNAADSHQRLVYPPRPVVQTPLPIMGQLIQLPVMGQTPVNIRMGKKIKLPVMGQTTPPILPNTGPMRNRQQELPHSSHFFPTQQPQAGPSHRQQPGPSLKRFRLASNDLTLSSRLNLPPGTVVTVVNSATNVNHANNNPDAPSSSKNKAFSAQFTGEVKEKRKDECSDNVKNKNVKAIESYLNNTFQSLLESERLEFELEEKVQVKKALFERKCLAEKLEMDERQHREVENILEGHTLESQKLDEKHTAGRKHIEDEFEHDKYNLKNRICETKSIMKSLKLNFAKMTTSPIANCPECPICFDSFRPPKKLVQCVNGHLLCLECRQKPQVQECPTCREQLTGRATAYEQLLNQMFGGGG